MVLAPIRSCPATSRWCGYVGEHLLASASIFLAWAYAVLPRGQRHFAVGAVDEIGAELFSSALTWKDTAGWVRPSLRAAPLKEPRSAPA